MDYNEHLVRPIERFGRSVRAKRLPAEASQKLLSVLGCLEYQVEEGHCPAPVVRHLQAAMRSWLEAVGNTAGLAKELDACVAAILKAM